VAKKIKYDAAIRESTGSKITEGGVVRIGITGASGSLGSALIDALHKDYILVGMTRDELKAEKIMAGKENVRCMVIAAGLDDEAAMRRAFDGCHVIIHAAALKRISGSVYAAHEMVKTNIVGTQTLLRVARDLRVSKVIVVSSDKAVEATNLYGSSKFCAECIAVQENSFSVPKGMQVCVVRYGNVLGSRGSVVHIWRDQIRRTNQLTLTDRRMTRFIITMSQAVQTIKDAIGSGHAGDILIPNLKAARMVDLASAVMREQGCFHAQMLEMGLRPGGEKLHESLLSQEEIARTHRVNERYWSIEPSHATWKKMVKNPLAFFDRAKYTSDSVELLTVDELTELLTDVPNRPPND
jgi:UDP-N-acetylglucosamine 4,6-dehydratase